MRMIVNLLRSTMYIGLSALIGYYNFQVNGGIGFATNVCFFALGFLAVSTWKRSDIECPDCPDCPEFVMKATEEFEKETPEQPLEN